MNRLAYILAQRLRPYWLVFWGITWGAWLLFLFFSSRSDNGSNDPLLLALMLMGLNAFYSFFIVGLFALAGPPGPDWSLVRRILIAATALFCLVGMIPAPVSLLFLLIKNTAQANSNPREK